MPIPFLHCLFATIAALCVLSMGSPQYAHAEQPTSESRFHVSVEGTYLIGPVGGQLQTPSGGMPGTTSDGRPTLEELGLDTAHIYDAMLLLGFNNHELYFGGQWIGMSNDAALDETLVSQANVFTSGSTVESDLTLDWYRIGYRYRIGLGDGPGEGSVVLLYPAFGFAMLDFKYKLDGEDGSSVDRSYRKGSVQLGLTGEWRLTERFSLAGGVLSSVPTDSTALIIMADLTARYRFVQTHAGSVVGFIGIAYEKIAYDDENKQEVGNDINVDLGPLLKVGLQFQF